MALLEVRDLRTQFRTDDGIVKAVDGVSLLRREGQDPRNRRRVGLQQERHRLTIMGLNNKREHDSERGGAAQGREPADGRLEQLREIRGNEIAMIFQDPMTSLNPCAQDRGPDRGGDHAPPARDEEGGRARAIEMLEGRHPAPSAASTTTRTSSPAVCAARDDRHGAVMHPDLLIADEPTTALDVTSRRRSSPDEPAAEGVRLAIIFITHDLASSPRPRTTCSSCTAGPSSAGRGPTTIFKRPHHPYTWGLLGSMPRLDADPDQRLVQIQGQPPSAAAPAAGCRFHPRCPT